MYIYIFFFIIISISIMFGIIIVILIIMITIIIGIVVIIIICIIVVVVTAIIIIILVIIIIIYSNYYCNYCIYNFTLEIILNSFIFFFIIVEFAGNSILIFSSSQNRLAIINSYVKIYSYIAFTQL